MCYESLNSDALKKIEQTCKNNCISGDKYSTQLFECIESHLSKECGTLFGDFQETIDELPGCATDCMMNAQCSDAVQMFLLAENCMKSECRDETERMEQRFEQSQDEFRQKCSPESAGAVQICADEGMDIEASAECVPGCKITDIGDGDCDSECLVAECTWDAGDCDGDLTL